MLITGLLLIIAGFAVWYFKRIFILLAILVTAGVVLIIIDIFRTIKRRLRK